MNVGLAFDLRNPPGWPRPPARLYGHVLELCEEADRLGAHSIWLSEHHGFPDGYLPRPLTFAAAVAARTRRVRIGTGLALAPLTPAAALAEDAAVVDVLSAGRLELGLGPGYRRPEFDLYGADFASRRTATLERAAELRRLWQDGRVTPQPVQERVPIWLGFLGPLGARRAGRLGEGLLTIDPTLAPPYLEGLAEGGHPPARGRMAGPIAGFVSDDPERDWPLVARHLAYDADSYRSLLVEGTGQPIPPPIDPDRWRARGLGARLGSFLLATPEDAARQLRAFTAGTPVETVFLPASLGGMPEDVAARHVETICRRLAPLLAAAADQPRPEGATGC